MRRRTRIHLFASRVHKWLALVIGAQLLIWLASGALMSFLAMGIAGTILLFMRWPIPRARRNA